MLAQYANKFEGYSAFASAYVETVRAGRSMDTIASESEISTRQSKDAVEDRQTDAVDERQAVEIKASAA